MKIIIYLSDMQAIMPHKIINHLKRKREDLD